MNRERIFIDFHCHPTLKPFGKSFPERKHASNRNRKNSIWHDDRPNIFEKGLNYLAGLTKFKQSDMSTLAEGGAICISAALYPPEQGFFKPLDIEGRPADLITDLVTGLSVKRIDYIQSHGSYFKDLEEEYKFLKALEGKIYKVGREKYTYKIINSYSEIEALARPSEVHTIGIFLSIEGLHVLNCGMEEAADRSEVMKNVRALKEWENRIFFVTFAHHFFNELAGHARSLDKTMSKFIDQGPGTETGFTDLGKEVLHELLDDESGKPIFIDVKHMNVRSRREYYTILKEEYSEKKIPIIVSHGAVTGYFDEREKEAIPGKPQKFNSGDINFYDFEILEIEESHGIFGLQLDERRIGSKQELDNAKGKLRRRKILFHRSKLLWNQIEHIAEVLDIHDRYAWGIQALGTDFDGIIDPLNGYWTSNEVGKYLEHYLLMHAYDFMNGKGKGFKAYNQIDPEEIVERVLKGNGISFLEKFY
jgi:microsomal dipeptidase-like Zn-dependent dipeptidase